MLVNLLTSCAVFLALSVLFGQNDALKVIGQDNVKNNVMNAAAAAVNDVDIDRCTACRITTAFVTEAVHYGNMSLEVIEAGARIACAAEWGQQVEPACDLILHRMNDIIRWIGTGMTPADICKSLDLCCTSSSHWPKAYKQHVLLPTEPIVTGRIEETVGTMEGYDVSITGADVNNVDTTVEATDVVPLIVAPKKKNRSKTIPDPCVFCMHTVTTIEDALKQDNSMVEEVRLAVDILCKYLSDKSTCHLLLEHYDIIASWLKKRMDPRMVCQKLHTCPSNDLSDVSLTKTKILFPDPCEFCTQMTAAIEAALLQDSSSIKVVRKEVEMICNYLEDDSKCQVVLHHFDEVSGWLSGGLSPRDVCKKLSLCPAVNKEFSLCLQSTDRIQTFILAQEKQSDLQTKYSKFQNKYSNHSPVMVEIKKTGWKRQIESVCDYLNDDEMCQFVLLNYPKIKQGVIDGLERENICHQVLNEENNHALDLPCMLCTATSQEIQVMSQYDKSTIPILKQGLETLCSKLPDALFKCDNLIDHFDELSQLIQNGTSPEDACVKIGMCTATTAQVNNEMTHISNERQIVGGQITSEYSAALDLKIKVMKKMFDNSDISCALCLSVSSSIKSATNKVETSVLKKGLEAVCNVLPGEANCQVLLNQFDDLAKMIHENHMSVEAACLKIGSCKQAEMNPVFVKETYETTEPVTLINSKSSCFFCKSISSLIVAVIRYKKSDLTQLKQGLAATCTIVPEEEKCDLLLTKFDNLVELLENGHDSAELACEKIKLCNNDDAVTSVVSSQNKKVGLVVVPDNKMAVE